jgi:hypothetical protein
MNATTAPETAALAAAHVYQAVAQVSSALCERGIAKSRQNVQQKYAFRGIDDFYNALAPELVRAGLCILPRATDRQLTERKSKEGGALWSVTVTMEFDLVSTRDGSKHTVGPFYGEAMDSGDKATNKAMSAAYKYCVMQTFAVPVEGQSVDSESDDHHTVTLTEEQETLLLGLRDASLNGMEAFKTAWRGLKEADREALRSTHFERLKYAATQADKDAGRAG